MLESFLLYICLQTLSKVILAIKAFEQYRSKTVVENPGARLLEMIRDEAEPNLHQKPISIEDQEFNRWYAEAIDAGFCLDIPKNHLGSQDGELVVKVRAEDFPGGYQLVKWRDAQLLMGK